MGLSRRDFVKLCGAGATVVGLSTLTDGQALAQASGPTGRQILPIPDLAKHGPAAVYAQDVQYIPAQLMRPPDGAPNVVIVLIDDMGFGAPSTFGGPIHMPTQARLAAEGLTYNRFHTTALCSPTRQALLTGRNHHSVGMGSITETATTAPGYTSVRPNSAATIADTVNTASRIENLTKYYRAGMLLSEDSYLQIAPGEELFFRYLGKVQVMGKQKPLGIYECFSGDEPQDRQLKMETREQFEAAVEAYFKQDFTQALQGLLQVLAHHPQDQAAHLFMEEARRLAAEGAPPGWTGVVEMRAK